MMSSDEVVATNVPSCGLDFTLGVTIFTRPGVSAFWKKSLLIPSQLADLKPESTSIHAILLSKIGNANMADSVKSQAFLGDSEPAITYRNHHVHFCALVGDCRLQSRQITSDREQRPQAGSKGPLACGRRNEATQTNRFL